MSSKKIRIYTLVKEILEKKNLDKLLEEKEKKRLGKEILEACKELGLGEKKISSSLSYQEAHKALELLKESPPETLLNEVDSPVISKVTSKKPPQEKPPKKVRLLRRIKKEEEPEKEEKSSEELKQAAEESEEKKAENLLEKTPEGSLNEYSLSSSFSSSDTAASSTSVTEERRQPERREEKEIKKENPTSKDKRSFLIEKSKELREKLAVEQKSLLQEESLDKEAYLSEELKTPEEERAQESILETQEEKLKEETQEEIKKEAKKEEEEQKIKEVKRETEEKTNLSSEKSEKLEKSEKESANTSPATLSLRERIALYEKRKQEKRENISSQRPNLQQDVTSTSTPERVNKESGSFSSRPYRVARPIGSFTNTRKKPAGLAGGKGGSSSYSARKKGGNNNSSKKKQEKQKTQAPKEVGKSQVPKELQLAHAVSVKELSLLIKVSENEIIKFLFLKGVVRTINQSLDVELIKDVCENFGSKLILKEEENEEESLSSRLSELVGSQKGEKTGKSSYSRAPVVVIMGHVDHGKTTLLDAIRNSRKQITESESGGITQHIGAYQVNVQDYDQKERRVTFLDTPGHEAFTALRARGAQVTDLAILVVSADDGVMPQTIEAIAHARASGIPIIVAVNKIDKPDAKPENVLSQLAEQDLLVEDYGGSTVCALVSAKQALNLDDLLAKITLVADTELEEKLLANKTSQAVGAVIESSLSSNRGVTATLLVQNGHLKKGDFILAGSATGRIRAIFNDEGKEVEKAFPSDPVQVLGLDKLPQAGDIFQICQSIQEAKEKAESALEKEKHKSNNVGLEGFSSQVKEGIAKELQIIIKSDVQGSAEAVASEIQKLGNEEVQTRIILHAAGAVTENDINLASTTGAIVVNFNSFVDAQTSKLAERLHVPIYTYDVIYHLTDQVKKAISGLLEPEKVEVFNGRAEIRKVFAVGKNAKIAGCYVLEGKVLRGSIAKIRREQKIIGTTSLKTLKRFKDDAKEVSEGFECGISLEGFTDFQEGDSIESWKIEFKEREV